jgi:NAD(P)H-flavin reductase
MKQTQAIIERVRRVNDTHQHLYLAVDASLSGLLPGQSLLARTTDRWDPYLREQWWPVGIGNNTLVVERPLLQHYEPGQVVDVLGVLGQPYKFRRTLRNVLLMAYDTEPTPLMMPVASLVANRVSVTLLLLGSAAGYGTEYLPAEVEVIQGDSDLNWPNRVTTVGWAACFGRVWQALRELRAEIPDNFLLGVFRPILPCGVGACSACMVRTRGGVSLICADGPALDLTEVPLG